MTKAPRAPPARKARPDRQARKASAVRPVPRAKPDRPDRLGPPDLSDLPGLPGRAGSAGPAGAPGKSAAVLRVQSSQTRISCAADETLISAYCSNPNSPIQQTPQITPPRTAECVTPGQPATVVVITCAKL